MNIVPKIAATSAIFRLLKNDVDHAAVDEAERVVAQAEATGRTARA